MCCKCAPYARTCCTTTVVYTESPAVVHYSTAQRKECCAGKPVGGGAIPFVFLARVDVMTGQCMNRAGLQREALRLHYCSSCIVRLVGHMDSLQILREPPSPTPVSSYHFVASHSLARFQSHVPLPAPAATHHGNAASN